MRIEQNLTFKIRYLIDEFVPPILRDQYWLMYIPIKLVFKSKTGLVMYFKKKAMKMSEKQFTRVYEDIIPFAPQRASDLNKKCFKKISNSIVGNNVLEIGCGKGLLALEISKKYKITATDIVLDKELIKKKNQNLNFKIAKAESLPFKNNSFDTVLTTHTLEHVRDLEGAIKEIRRVARKRIIIVVPKQRPYKYTFDLHIHFFPYPESFEILMGNVKNAKCDVIAGDLIYIENIKK